MKILLQRKSDGMYWGYGRWVNNCELAVGFMSGFAATEFATLKEHLTDEDFILHYVFPDSKYNFAIDSKGPIK